MALHDVFDTPRDRLVWDVSHQTYPHKILTGPRGGIRKIRQNGGLYGFTKRSESEYDPFGGGLHDGVSDLAHSGSLVARCNRVTGVPVRRFGLAEQPPGLSGAVAPCQALAVFQPALRCIADADRIAGLLAAAVTSSPLPKLPVAETARSREYQGTPVAAQ